MKKFVLVGCTAVASTLSAQGVDTTRVSHLSEAHVITNRATKRSPIAYANLDKAVIERINYGQDIPFLLSTLPSTIVTSDAGNGVGYTSIRVRGTDMTRINVTANGIPMNDPESHGLYWVNMGDFASSLQDLQVQRGVGTSTNGAGAFGASINMLTDRASAQPYASVNVGYGSFNTTKNTVKLGTGLLNDRWTLDGRMSYLASDGYRDRATTRLGSYFVQGAYFNEGTILKLIAFGGKEKTYLAWDGISREQLTTDRKHNPLGDMGNGQYYKNHTDNYFQQHAQVLLTQKLADRWNLNAALHYTHGQGYYEQYRKERKLKKFGLLPFEHAGKTIEKTDLIYRKHLYNHFGGAVASVNYRDEQWDVTFGGGVNQYDNDHYGEVIWAKNYIGQLTPNHEYYRYKGKKFDGNTYLRANYAPTSNVNLYADVQYRLIKYTLDGTSDKKKTVDANEKFNFFNPKVGAVWNVARDQQVYASLSVAHREPTNNNYTEGYSSLPPKSERLMDYEVGYRIGGRRFDAAVNGYWMQYKNQFVLNGQYNEIGEAVVENVPNSYRAGIELSGAWKPCETFRWEANLTLSSNRIKDHVAYLYDGDYKEYALPIGHTTIAFSPAVTFNNIFHFRHKGFAASLTSQYVSRQYLDNMQMKENALDAYFVSHLNAAYRFKMPGVKEVTIGATVYNLFNEKYETNGYSQTNVAGTTPTGDIIMGSDPRFYPMAGTNFMLNLGLKF